MDTYQEIPYDSTPFSDTHPDHLAVLGRLFGLETADPAHCRVLELGCAGGGNLIPLAYYQPGSRFVGIDLSAAQIAAGNALVTELGLSNIELHQGDILQLGSELGQFDYIIAHGVYSWIPGPVRDRLLALCRELLSEDGVAYISYNTLPGWRMRGMLRDMLLYHTRSTEGPRQRLERAYELLDTLEQALAGRDALSADYLRQEITHLRGAHPSYLYHEYMEEINQPFLFSEFVDDAGRHGLQYLADVELHTMFPSALGEAAERQLERFDDLIELEQYMDFIRNRHFRRTLLCHGERTLHRELALEQIGQFALHADLAPPENLDLSRIREQEFALPDGQRYGVAHPLTKAALLHLASIYPAAITLPELIAAAQSLAAARGGKRYAEQSEHLIGELFSLYAHQMVRLAATPRSFGAPDTARPRANRLAQLQASAGLGHAATPRHGVVQLDPFAAQLLQLADGSRSQSDLAAAMQRLIEEGRIEIGDAGRRPDRNRLAASVASNVQRLIGVFARQGLLEGRGPTRQRG